MAEVLIDQVVDVAMYPIKSCQAALIGGETPTRLAVGETGFEMDGVRDRDFLIYDPDNNQMVTQRGWDGSKRVVHPQDRLLASVRTDIRVGYLDIDSDIGELSIKTGETADGPVREVDVFGKRWRGVEQQTDASGYFSELLKREVILLRSDRGHRRVIPERYSRHGAANVASAVDGMPFLMTSQASLGQAHERNGATPDSVPMNRYRPNIVISGQELGPYGEDYIAEAFTIGAMRAWVVKACSRCPVPNIDQVTGDREGGALRILRDRAGEIFTGETGVFFGQNLVYQAAAGLTIAVGQSVKVYGMTDEPNVTLRNNA